MYRSENDLPLIERKIAYHEEQIRLLNENRRELINYLNLNKQKEEDPYEVLQRRTTHEQCTSNNP